MATLTISLDRTSLSLSPLVLSGIEDANVWGIAPGFTPPMEIPRVRYAGSAWGRDVATGFNWQQGIIVCDVFPRVADTAALNAEVAALKAALAQIAYQATIARNGVATVWDCSPSGLAPAAIDLYELEANEDGYALNIPCYPAVGA